MCVHMHVTEHTWVRGKFARVVSLFHNVGPGDQTQVVRLHGKCLYQLRYLTSLHFTFYIAAALYIEMFV